MTFGLIILLAEILFMAAAQFGAMSIPLTVWIVWTIIGAIAVYLKR